nr:RluA family pseudouridine synthase [Salirhabdus euzebyi]
MHWTIEKEQEGMLVRDYLISVRAFSRRMLKVIKVEGAILLNEVPVTVRAKVQVGDKLEITFPEERKGEWLKPEPVPLEIVYEDEDVIVLDKQPGVPVIPSRQHHGGTIANGLIHYYEKNKLTFTVHIVTRLDRDTSGLVLIAKHRFSHSLLSITQKEGNVKRSYTAVVTGKLLEKTSTIDEPIGRKPTSIIEREVREDGQRAVTHYNVEQENEQFSVVKVLLETGRTHQIRVHFSYLGHPLLGDDLYGGSLDRITRQALHCHKLSFLHPFKEEWIHLQSEIPRDIELLINSYSD